MASCILCLTIPDESGFTNITDGPFIFEGHSLCMKHARDAIYRADYIYINTNGTLSTHATVTQYLKRFAPQ